MRNTTYYTIMTTVLTLFTGAYIALAIERNDVFLGVWAILPCIAAEYYRRLLITELTTTKETTITERLP